MKKFEMAANVSALQDYIDQVGKDELIMAVAGSAKSIGLFASQDNVNAPTHIHLMELATSFQNGLGCSLNDNTTATFSDRVIEPAFLKSEFVLCDDDFRKTWMAYNGKFTASNHEVPFEKQMVEKFVEGIGENLEDYVWNGITLGSKTYDGLADIVKAEGTKVKAGATAGIYDKVVALIKGVPAKSRKKTEIFIGEDDMLALQEELLKKDFRLIDLSYTNGAGEVEGNAMKMPVFGTVIREVTALNGSGDVLAIVPEHAVYGYSSDNAETDVEYVYDAINRRHIFRARLAAGVQIAYPAEVAYAVAED